MRRALVLTALLGLATTASARTSQAVRGVVDTELPILQACYELYLQADPALSGRLALNIGVAANGAVTSASVVTSSAAQADLANCVVEAARRWQFGRGEEVALEIPLYFKPTTTAPTDITPPAAPTAATPAKATQPRAPHPGPYFVLSVAALMIVSLSVLLWLLRR